MTATLEPYPDYKPSGVEWLGDVPAHWTIRRLKTCAANVVDQTDEHEDGEICLALEDVESWTGRYEEAGSYAGLDSQAKRFRVGDLLFCKLRPYLAKVVRPNRAGICTGEFLVLRPSNSGVTSHYQEQLLRSRPVIDAIDASTFGARMPRAEWKFIGGMDQPVPPLAEQVAIVNYLHHVDQHIQHYINVKQKLIGLLEEQRQVVIHRAVTRGLDPNVRLKPSGVSWIGNVPVHWEMRRLKTLCKMRSGDGITADLIEPAGLYPVYGGNGLRGYTTNYTHDGSFVLIGRQGALCGNVHIARGRFWASEHAVVASLFSDHVVEWFAAILGVMNLNQYSISAAQPGLAVDRVLDLSLPVPPLQEQIQIARSAERETADIDAAIARTHREIELMREYRERLIADVVTGKLDVRKAVSRLGGGADTSKLPGDLAN